MLDILSFWILPRSGVALVSRDREWVGCMSACSFVQIQLECGKDKNAVAWLGTTFLGVCMHSFVDVSGKAMAPAVEAHTSKNKNVRSDRLYLSLPRMIQTRSLCTLTKLSVCCISFNQLWCSMIQLRILKLDLDKEELSKLVSDHRIAAVVSSLPCGDCFWRVSIHQILCVEILATSWFLTFSSCVLTALIFSNQPTFTFIKDKKVVDTIVGANPSALKSKIAEWAKWVSWHLLTWRSCCWTMYCAGLCKYQHICKDPHNEPLKQCYVVNGCHFLQNRKQLQLSTIAAFVDWFEADMGDKKKLKIDDLGDWFLGAV